jgi:hypothetical protein
VRKLVGSATGRKPERCTRRSHTPMHTRKAGCARGASLCEGVTCKVVGKRVKALQSRVVTGGLAHLEGHEDESGRHSDASRWSLHDIVVHQQRLRLEPVCQPCCDATSDTFVVQTILIPCAIVASKASPFVQVHSTVATCCMQHAPAVLPSRYEHTAPPQCATRQGRHGGGFSQRLLFYVLVMAHRILTCRRTELLGESPEICQALIVAGRGNKAQGRGQKLG